MSDNMCEHGGLDGNCLRCKDATITRLEAENERLKEERDDALATQIPPDSGAIRKLGERLADLLDEDDWNNAEPLLLAAQQSITTAEQENERLLGKVEAYEPIVAAVESHLQRAMQILKGGKEVVPASRPVLTPRGPKAALHSSFEMERKG